MPWVPQARRPTRSRSRRSARERLRRRRGQRVGRALDHGARRTGWSSGLRRSRPAGARSGLERIESSTVFGSSRTVRVSVRPAAVGGRQAAARGTTGTRGPARRSCRRSLPGKVCTVCVVAVGGAVVEQRASSSSRLAAEVPSCASVALPLKPIGSPDLPREAAVRGSTIVAVGRRVAGGDRDRVGGATRRGCR